MELTQTEQSSITFVVKDFRMPRIPRKLKKRLKKFVLGNRNCRVKMWLLLRALSTYKYRHVPVRWGYI